MTQMTPMNPGPDDALPELVDQGLFRDVIGRFATGVTIVSTRHDDADLGTTASAVSSLSMDPPMLLVCMNRTSETGQAILASGRFAVNILGEDQADVAMRFATKGADKFAGVGTERGRGDVPLVADALACLECRVNETATGGTHTVFLAHVEHARATDRDPLTYFRGRFGRFEDAAQEAAYQQLRRIVMRRGTGAEAGQTLSVETLAKEFDLERPRVQYALMKLSADGLLERSADGWYTVRPLDARAAREAIQTRCMIEVGVADAMVGSIPDATLKELRRYAEAAAAAVAADPPDYALLRRSGRRFHETFVALPANDTLSDIYGRLRIDAIWGRLLKGRHLSPDYLLVLTDACAAGDAESARRALFGHAEHAATIVEEMIEEAGGEI
jgi:flavin reductase (DIM6/NTAB) family NADH-FMN oxidoreductase RutF/DNA-binding GntR family transcriptional regulator